LHEVECGDESFEGEGFASVTSADKHDAVTGLHHFVELLDFLELSRHKLPTFLDDDFETLSELAVFGGDEFDAGEDIVNYPEEEFAINGDEFGEVDFVDGLKDKRFFFFFLVLAFLVIRGDERGLDCSHAVVVMALVG
jgi:hypothetical protein